MSNNTLDMETWRERDEETGLYYYGARYLDAKTSRWLSTDPALGEYVPGAPINDEVKNANQNLPGMGGVFNTVNMHLYHYAGNNPVKYTDPDGRTGSFPDGSPEQDAAWERKQEAQFDMKFSFTITRDSDSYKTVGGNNSDLKGKDTLMINNNSTGESLQIPISSVPTMAGTDVGDALAEGPVELTLGPENGSMYSPNVMTISGGTLVNGDKLRSDGTTANNGIPWRAHDTLYFGSEGCLVGQKSNTNGSMVDVIDTLKSWGIDYGNTLKGDLTHTNHSV